MRYSVIQICFHYVDAAPLDLIITIVNRNHPCRCPPGRPSGSCPWYCTAELLTRWPNTWTSWTRLPPTMPGSPNNTFGNASWSGERLQRFRCLLGNTPAEKRACYIKETISGKIVAFPSGTFFIPPSGFGTLLQNGRNGRSTTCGSKALRRRLPTARYTLSVSASGRLPPSPSSRSCGTPRMRAGLSACWSMQPV